MQNNSNSNNNKGRGGGAAANGGGGRGNNGGGGKKAKSAQPPRAKKAAVATSTSSDASGTAPVTPKAAPSQQGKRNNNNNNKSTTAQTTTTSTTQVAPIDLNALPLGQDKGSCLTCCEPITVYAVGSCNHRNLCWLCFLRRRVLYNQKDCCLCKQVLDVGVFTHSDSPFAELPLSKYLHDKKHQLYFQDRSLEAQVGTLFQVNCPACPETAPTSCATLPNLKNHLKQAHSLFYCEVCLEGKKVFLNEQKTYTAPDLDKHKKGVGEPEQERHQYCEFCRTLYYDKDDIYNHLTQRHFTCHICERDGIRYHYYRSYNTLEQHFRKEHYLCEDQNCLAEKFVVFRTALDFKAHQVNVHLDNRNMSKAELRAARTVDASILFAQDRPGSGSRSENGGRRGRGRDEDRVMIFSPLIGPSGANPVVTSNAAPPTTPTYIPTTPARNETNGTGDGTPEAKSKKSKQDKRRGRPPEPPPVSLQSKVEQEIREGPAMTDEERAKRNRELVERIQGVLTPQRFEDFRKMSSELRAHRITPADYYRRFLATFPSHVAGAIFVDLVNLLPDPVLRAALLTLHSHALSHPEEWESTQGPGESYEDEQARQEAWEYERIRERHERTAAAQSSVGAGWRPPTQRAPNSDEFPSLSSAQRFSPRDYEPYEDSSYYDAVVDNRKDRFHNTSGRGKKGKQKATTTLLRFG